MIDTVIFDMDGVLIDSEPIHWQVNQDYFASIGAPILDDEYSDRFVGLPLDKMLEHIKETRGIDRSIEEMFTESMANHLEAFSNADLVAVPGIPELIRALKKKGFNLAVGSSSASQLIDIILSKIGLKEYFDITVSGFEVDHGKPAPDIFLEVASRFKVNPEHCLVIEDSALGIKAAKSANMKVVGVRNNTSGNQNLSQADLLVHGFSEESRDRIFALIEQGIS
ncbi:MAG: HAD family phosphatase [Sphaerochaetaceae bacterium]|nr:HAD family phosphatase [Sphaerochaetaceae bacterium]